MSRYHCFCHFARVHYVIIKASHDGCWGLYQSKAGWPGVKSQQQYFQSPISVNNSRESASRGSPLFAHQQQPRSLLLLHSTTHTQKKKKNLHTRPSQIPNGTQTQSPLSQPVSLTHPESSDAGAWEEGREGTTPLSSRSTGGMRPRRFKGG